MPDWKFTGSRFTRGVSAAAFDPRRAVLLVQLPSGFRCIWYNLPHLVQFVVLFLVSAVEVH